ncbi:circadian clock-controlled protein daywake-like [Vanessa cardui]|uniref:circadian clock-controlled protein daywake-like n=1 Tax=Vanessa cardui TaxID=171605 RepID=UPI001F137875|nr:circadian clock-controlled protein daywake-like [Vanessa cardui]
MQPHLTRDFYSLAPFIARCHATNSTCLRLSSQYALPIIAAGIPSLGMSSLDPMAMKQVKAVQSGLKMDFKNTTVRGLRNCKVLELRRFTHKTEIDLKCSVTLIGYYSLNGKLLVLPIEGQGKYKIKIQDVIVKVVLDIEEVESDGELYWKVKGFKQTADVVGRAQFNFQNLFNGNRQLSDPVHEFANTNWKDIFQEVAPPIVNTIVSQIVDETIKFFDKVPIRQLVL